MAAPQSWLRRGPGWQDMDQEFLLFFCCCVAFIAGYGVREVISRRRGHEERRLGEEQMNFDMRPLVRPLAIALLLLAGVYLFITPFLFLFQNADLTLTFFLLSLTPSLP